MAWEKFMAELPAREAMEFDVVVVGAGPAGLAAAIRLKQLNAEISVVVVEKGSEVGAHILSGVVIDPSALDRLLPEWRADPEKPLKTEVTDDRFYWLTEKGSIRFPLIFAPPLMSNHGCFIGSLGLVCKYLAAKAEALGVEIYPGFAATDVLFDQNGAVAGIATGDMGVAKNGTHKDGFMRGMELRAKYTLFAEGVRGSLSKILLKRFDLSKDRDVPKFGIGLKEIWQVAPEKHVPGLTQHSFGWPLGTSLSGGSFIYHYEDNLVSVGFVVPLGYDNPYLSPFEEFQRFKTHPLVRGTFEGGKRIKGTHNAMTSGMLAAEACAEALKAGRAHDELSGYEKAWRTSSIGKDLWKVRNVKPLLTRFGTVIGVGLSGLDMWTNTLLGFSLFGTLKHGKPDYASLKPASECAPIAYPKPDGKLTFDRLSSVFLSNTNHEEDQPVHLHVADPALQKASEHDVFGGPSARYCPAGVYEWVEEAGIPKFVINAQNCVHCKTCDIKDPSQNITWVPPEGGGGPNYPNM
jgi:electron-transferring-flavoprotein dehydrogenase